MNPRLASNLPHTWGDPKLLILRLYLVSAGVTGGCQHNQVYAVLGAESRASQTLGKQSADKAPSHPFNILLNLYQTPLVSVLYFFFRVSQSPSKDKNIH